MSAKDNGRFAGFTLIEVLVVAVLISLLSTIGIFTYQGALRSSRDARRTADIETLRSALELYRNTNDLYPAAVDVSCSSTTGISDGTNTYLPKNPHDPKCAAQTYYYTQLSGGADYTLGAHYEGATSSTSSCGDCGAIGVCNYCVGPLGGK